MYRLATVYRVMAVTDSIIVPIADHPLCSTIG